MRKIKKVYKPQAVVEGAGVHLYRAFGYSEVPSFDPFLLLDDFRNDKKEDYLPGFPFHPHRGIETITYILEGEVEHQDSLGNKGVIGKGDVQWMSAGSGIIHQEMPLPDTKDRMYGFQLWANLPAKDKMMKPRYQEIKSSDIPVIKRDDGTTIRVIAGSVDGVKGPVSDIMIQPEYLDITVAPHTTFSHKTKSSHNLFAYVFEGEAVFCSEEEPFSYESVESSYFDMERTTVFGNRTLILYDKGESFSIKTGESMVRFLLVSGMPLDEPVAWYGPIVMNTQEELKLAFDEYRSGTFIKE